MGARPRAPRSLVNPYSRCPTFPGPIRHRRTPEPDTSSRNPPSPGPGVPRASRAAPGGGGRDRTDDPLLAKQVLSQLSYAPDAAVAMAEATGARVWDHGGWLMRLVGQGGLEPPTSRLSSARSNQLSY